MPQNKNNKEKKIYYFQYLLASFAFIYLIYQVVSSNIISPRLETILSGSKIISDGGLIYIDFKTIISPGIFYLNSILNNNLLLIKFISSLNIVLISVCIYYITSKLINKDFAIYPSVLSIILIAKASPWGSVWAISFLFILISAIFIFKYLDNNNNKYILLSGLMIGIAALFRHEMAGFIFGAFFQAVFFMSLTHSKVDSFTKNKRILYGLKNAMRLVLGLLPVLPFAIYLMIKIPIDILWEQLFVLPFTVFRVEENISFPSLIVNINNSLLFDLWFGIVFYSTLITIILLVYYIVKNVKNKSIELNGIKFWQLLMVFNICLNLFNIPMIVSDYWHFLPVLVSGNIILFLFISEIKNNKIKLFILIITLLILSSPILLNNI